MGYSCNLPNFQIWQCIAGAGGLVLRSIFEFGNIQCIPRAVEGGGGGGDAAGNS